MYLGQIVEEKVQGIGLYLLNVYMSNILNK